MEVLDQIKERLKDFTYTRGGSHHFNKEVLFRPNWLIGYHIKHLKIMFVPPEDSWLKIEATLTGDEVETFYEGSCDSLEDFETIIRLLKFEI